MSWQAGSFPLQTAGIVHAPTGSRRPDGPRYERLGPIGSGAMGTVHLGWDAWLGRNVALKVPNTQGDDHDLLTREAQLAARLDHPAIATIHDLGHDAELGTFFVMRLVDGRPIGELFDDVAKRPEAMRALRLACGALAHAHARGIVHRDLSPSNILVGAHGEVAVIDWGVAAERGAGAGDRVGTPGFTSPEQRAGEPAEPADDVWSLGALLAQILGADPPVELAAVRDRALAPPATRYPDAAALERDLIAWEEGRRVSAYAYTATDRLVRAAVRLRWLLAGTALALTALAVQAGLAGARVIAERDRALVAEQRATEALASALATQAHLALGQGDRREAASLATRAGTHPLALGVLASTDADRAPEPLMTRQLPSCSSWSLPGAGEVAVCTDRGAEQVVPWAGEPWGPPQRIIDARVDGDTLLLLDEHRALRRYPMGGGPAAAHDRDPGVFTHGTHPWRTRWRPGAATRTADVPCASPHAEERVGDVRWIACMDGQLLRIDANGAHSLAPPGGEVTDHLVAVGGEVWGAAHSGTLRRVDTPGPRAELGEPVASVRVGPDRQLLVHGNRGRARILDTATGRWALDLGRVDAATLDPSGDLTTLVGTTWTRHRLPPRDTIAGWQHPNGLAALAIHPDGREVAVGTADGTLARLPLTGDAPAELLQWQPHLLKSLAYLQDGGLAVSAMYPNESRRFPHDGGPPVTVNTFYRRMLGLEDGSLLLAEYVPGVEHVRPDGSGRRPLTHLEAWDLSATGRAWPALLATADGALAYDGEQLSRVHPGPLHAVAAAPSGFAIADRATVEVQHRRGSWITEQASQVTDMVWIDDDLLAVGDVDGTLRLYTADGELRVDLPLHDDRIGALAHHGEWLLSAGWDGRLQRLSLRRLRSGSPRGSNP